MQPLTVFLNRRNEAALNLARWKEEAGYVQKIMACAAFALLTALLAQLRLVLPFTPVPFTGQVLAVLLAGFFLGRMAPLSVGMYIGMGSAFGWFSGFTGFAAFASVTGGYLIGFVAAAGIVGELTHHGASGRRILFAMGLASAVILACGAAWLCLGFGVPLSEAIVIGVLPFVVVDAIKVAIAATVARSLSARTT